jgi:hypothetical protein
MQVVYPSSGLEPRFPDESFVTEGQGMSAAGHSVSLIDLDRLAAGTSAIKPSLPPSSVVLYRGWMITPDEYANLARSIDAQGGSLFTNLSNYVATHYLPNWYPILADLTPETVILEKDADVVGALRDLDWPGYFIKDYVKSLKTSVGSLVARPEDANIVLAEMEKYRGTIEGGICIRRVEDFLPGSETRYFVRDGTPYSATGGSIPRIVWQCAERIASRFFSVDVALSADGSSWVVEVGDGQVSDLVGAWTVDTFVGLWNGAV